MPASLKQLAKKAAKIQGTAARLTAHIPAPVQRKLAQLLGYSHQEQYPDLDPHLQLLLAIRKLKGDSSLVSSNPEKDRRHFSAEMAAISGKPTPVGAVRNLTIPGEAGPLAARLYVPQRHCDDTVLLVFYHGGGFVVGDLDTHDEACRILCKFGRFKVLSTEYRLAPEYPAPAAVHDCIAALKWAKAHADEFGVDPNRIAVGGDSAGGNLATTVSQQTKGTADAPFAQLLIYPTVDRYHQYPSQKAFSNGLFLSERDADNANQAYVLSGGLTLDNPIVTPMMGDMHGLPPALVYTAAYDILRDEAEEYVKRLKGLGNSVILHRVKDQGHGFINISPINKAAKRATIRMAKDFHNFMNQL